MRRIIAAILALGALMGLLGVTAPAALADGDPAAVVLTARTAFIAADAGGSVPQDAQLASVVDDVNAHGYPLRVAVIGSQDDLGYLSQLWKDPDGYAIYLGRELASGYRGSLLVTMPGQRPSLRVPGVPSQGDTRWGQGVSPLDGSLVSDTLSQVRRLAADNGIAVSARADASVTGAGGSVDLTEVLALVLGALATLAAWAVSLRRRPLRRGVMTS